MWRWLSAARRLLGRDRPGQPERDAGRAGVLDDYLQRRVEQILGSPDELAALVLERGSSALKRSIAGTAIVGPRPAESREGLAAALRRRGATAWPEPVVDQLWRLAEERAKWELRSRL